MNVKETVVQYFLNKDKSQQWNETSIVSLNYLENHFFTSIEFIQMVSELEETFSLTFSDEHLKSADFATVGTLIRLIEQLSQKVPG